MNSVFPYTHSAIMRFFWNLVSMLFIGVAVFLTWCWKAAWYLMNFTQDMAAVTGKRADHWAAIMKARAND